MTDEGVVERETQEHSDADEEQLLMLNSTSKLGAVPFRVVLLEKGQEAALYFFSWEISGRQTTEETEAFGL